MVKVHESTLRKRLVEFGETSASQLTEERQRAAGQLKEDELTKEFSEFHEIIEKELEERRTTGRWGSVRLITSCSRKCI